jgi:hypothetical protein
VRHQLHSSFIKLLHSSLKPLNIIYKWVILCETRSNRIWYKRVFFFLAGCSRYFDHHHKSNVEFLWFRLSERYGSMQKSGLPKMWFQDTKILKVRSTRVFSRRLLKILSNSKKVCHSIENNFCYKFINWWSGVEMMNYRHVFMSFFFFCIKNPFM